MILIAGIKTQTVHKEATLSRRYLSENLLISIISQSITISDQSISRSIQCFDCVGWAIWKACGL